MSTQLPSEGLSNLDRASEAAAERPTMLRLYSEAAGVSKRVRRTLVRAFTTTAARTELIEADLEQVQVIVNRVAVGRIIDAVPPVRLEGDVTIMPVVEEKLVLVRRLVLKEEVRLRTVRTVSRHAETVSLREQDVTITRTPFD